MRLTLKDRGPKFWYRLFTLFGYTFYVEGRWTGEYYPEDDMKEYKLFIYLYHKNFGIRKITN